MPDIIRVHRLENSVELELHVGDDLTVFDGHFDGAPVLAGVVQIKWALDMAKKFLNMGKEFEVEKLRSVKFHHIIRPGQNVNLKLTIENDTLEFAFNSEGTSHSSGKIEMA
jgi:3-hydroxymyristoyl/3-hydroxydecanoyl-(acyl carrier protein) dehydratase